MKKYIVNIEAVVWQFLFQNLSHSSDMQHDAFMHQKFKGLNVLTFTVRGSTVVVRIWRL